MCPMRAQWLFRLPGRSTSVFTCPQRCFAVVGRKQWRRDRHKQNACSNTTWFTKTGVWAAAVVC